MQEKIMALSLPEKLIAGGGVLMLIASFFEWWHFSIGGDVPGFSGSVGSDGWGAPGSLYSTLAILLSIILAGIVIATKLGNFQMPALPQSVTWAQIWGGGGAAIAVLMLLKAWRILAAPAGGFGIGFFLGVVALALIGYGCYMLYSAEKKGTVSA